MNKEKFISITGGTGHLGSCLIAILLQKNYGVNALYFNSKPTIIHPNLNWIKGDISKPSTFKELLKNASVLIHAAGIISIGYGDESQVYNINVTGTENLIDACIKQQVKMIYISSSAAVIETEKEEVYTENRPHKTEAHFLYDWTKATAEKKVLKSIEDFNLDAFIIRPTAIIGPPDNKPSHFGQSIIDMANYKMPFVTTGGYNLVDIRDVSQTIINSFNLGEQGKIYLVGGNYYTIKQIAKIANPKRYFVSIPLNFLIAILPFIKVAKKIFSLRWPITKESLTTLKMAPNQMDCSKAKTALNHSVRPITETIEDLLTWYRKQ
jgi:dihydroflavonol-4-reductase